MVSALMRIAAQTMPTMPGITFCMRKRPIDMREDEDGGDEADRPLQHAVDDDVVGVVEKAAGRGRGDRVGAARHEEGEHCEHERGEASLGPLRTRGTPSPVSRALSRSWRLLRLPMT